MLDQTDQDDARGRGKTRYDLEYAPYRACDMTALTLAAEDITQRCLDRILLWEAEKNAERLLAASSIGASER